MRTGNHIPQLALLTLAFLCGCRTTGSAREIVAIPLYSTENIASCEHVGIAEAIAGTGLRLHWNGPSDGAAQRQIDLFNDAVKKRAYGILLNPQSLYAANGVIRDALTHEIPVVVMLHRLPLSQQPHLSFVVEDLQTSAHLVAQRLRQTIPARGEVLLVGLDSLAAGGKDRFDAIEEALHHEAPEIPVAGRIAGSPRIGAFQAAIAEALRRPGEVRAIVALDSHAGYAAASVLHDGRLQQRIRLISFDQNTEVLAALRQGEVDAGVAQNMREMGKIAVANIVRDRRGEAVAPVTYVKPILVTRENIDTEDVQRILLMNWVQP